MRNIYLLIFTILACNLFASEMNDYKIPDFRIDTGVSHNLFGMEHKTENPFRDQDLSWFKEQLRREKLIIASGVIVTAVGVPFLIMGLLNIFVPNVDVTENSKNVYSVFTGIGGGFLAAGVGITITGGVLFGIENKKIKAKVTTPTSF